MGFTSHYNCTENGFVLDFFPKVYRQCEEKKEENPQFGSKIDLFYSRAFWW